MNVSRRSFLGSAVGLILAPRLIVRPEVDLHRVVQSFCDKEFIFKYDFRKPFVIDGTAYGTDARAMAWIPTVAEDTDIEARKTPDIRGVLDNFWHDAPGWRRLPPERLIATKYGTCPNCVDQPECKACHGEGTIAHYDADCFAPWESRCEACQGGGHVRNPACPICHGKRDGELPWLEQFGDQRLAAHLVRKVRAVPGVSWHPGRNDGPVMFRSGDFRALVMPVRKDL